MPDRLTMIALHLAPATMLVFALGKWPYGYYLALRVVVFFCAGLIAIDAHRRTSRWAVAFALAAVLFNPFFPLHLTRGIWQALNLAGALMFAAHLVVTMLRKPGDGEAESRP